MFARAVIFGIMAAMTIAPSSPTAADYTPYGIIYKATAPNGKAYIGQTTRPLAMRIKYHRWASRHTNNAFPRAIAKYGDEMRWEIVAECHSQLSLDAAEIRHIALAREAGIVLYNIKDGGSGGGKGMVFTKAARAKMSARAMGNTKRRGKKMTAKTCAKMSASAKARPSNRLGAKHTPETCAKMSAVQKHRRVRERQRHTGLLI